MKKVFFFSFLFFSYAFAANTILLKDLNYLKTTDRNFHYVYLIRHGESIYNLPDENGMYYTQGHSVPAPLTENGRKQAFQIARLLQKKISPNTKVTVASSTAKRASYTALSIFEALSKKCKAQLGGKHTELLEIAKGKWEGLPKDKAFNKEFSKWKELSAFKQWKTPQVSTAESLESAAIRATKTINKLLQKYPDQTLFIVSHGGTLMSVDQLLEKTKFSKDPNSNFPKFKYHNCDMVLLKIPKGKSINNASIELSIKSGFPNTYK